MVAGRETDRVRVGRPDRREHRDDPADGTDLRNLTPTGFQGQPSFSPDGKWIVYERDRSPTDNGVWIMRADGSDARPLTRNPFKKQGECGCDTDPNFSPDGKRITFVRISRTEPASCSR